MSSISHQGFTIIETMLFLAITGLLVVGLLVGAGSSINVQRYNDSVTSLKTTLQDQYSQVINVNSAMPPSQLTCDTNGVVVNQVGLPAGPRGQGDCVVMGQFITIVDTTITTNSVVGYNNLTSSAYINDIDELKDYKLSILPTNTSVNEIEWGSRIAWPKGGTSAKSPTTPRSIAILILRSPKSGLSYTFTSDTISSSKLSDMIVAGNTIPGQMQRRICIDPNGLLVNGGLAVFIGGYASGPTAVEIRSNDMGDASVC